MTRETRIARRTMLIAGAAAIGGMSLSGCTANALPIKVYKNAGCGCCKVWVQRLEAAGFETTVEDRDDLQELKKKLGVPDDLASCHTATVNRFVIEGHVPPADIKRLLAEKPAARGLSVPGMPVGSPGMEVEGQPNEAYTVWLFQDSGQRSPFAKYAAT